MEELQMAKKLKKGKKIASTMTLSLAAYFTSKGQKQG